MASCAVYRFDDVYIVHGWAMTEMRCLASCRPCLAVVGSDDDYVLGEAIGTVLGEVPEFLKKSDSREEYERLLYDMRVVCRIKSWNQLFELPTSVGVSSEVGGVKVVLYEKAKDAVGQVPVKGASVLIKSDDREGLGMFVRDMLR